MHTGTISQIIFLSLLSAPMAMHPAERPCTPSQQLGSSRASMRQMRHLLSAPSLIQPMGVYVGELQEKWQFPSDHLPVGMTLDGNHIFSWNVLDAEYMDWVIEKDSQGLKRSLIVDEHVYIDGSKLTIRDVHVADLILETIHHPEYPKSILSLQEASRPFLEHLGKRLPPNFKIVGEWGNAVLVDTNRFDILEENDVYGIFSQDKRPVQEVLLKKKESGKVLRLINVHLPGDPAGPARYEFGEYLAKSHKPNTVTISMGDMNFNELEMDDAMKKAGAEYTLFSPYCTNISPRTALDSLMSKDIDHFIIQGEGSFNCIANPEDVMRGLQETATLLLPTLQQQKAG